MSTEPNKSNEIPMIPVKTIVGEDQVNGQELKHEKAPVVEKPADKPAPPPSKPGATPLVAQPVSPTSIPTAPAPEPKEASKSPVPLVKATAGASNVKPTLAQALTHLQDLQNYYMSFSGKKDYNPHFYLLETIEPLKQALNTPPVSDALIAKALALKKDELNAKAPANLKSVSQIDLESGFKHLKK